jgi:hypothetical protein
LRKTLATVGGEVFQAPAIKGYDSKLRHHGGEARREVLKWILLLNFVAMLLLKVRLI